MTKLYYVQYNAKIVAVYRSICSCLKFIKRKGLKDDEANALIIYDNCGALYDPETGIEITH